MDKKPLAGKRILITRARDQAPVFTESLKNLGAEVIEFPTIEIVLPFAGINWTGPSITWHPMTGSSSPAPTV
jgi:hypothetical protein